MRVTRPSPDTPPAPASPTPSERVESWKEIAGYLKRDVRTVQRWEEREGLPVHRHMHGERGTVYAYKVELDAWWNNRRPKIEALEAKQAIEMRAARRRWFVVASAAILLAAASVGLWQPWRPRLSFQERDWVLITTFQNRTGEAIFDGMLEYALDRELSNSRFVNVAPRARIDDALQLMKRTPGTAIDSAVGREICLRDGGIRALLSGQIEKAETHYLLSASLMDPVSGATLAGVSEEADNRDEILVALRRLSNGVRETLGEQLPQIPPRNEKLEKATTPSLRALQLYSKGMVQVNQRQFAAGIPLLEQALAEDPEFASAHIHLANCLSNSGRHGDAGPHYQRAFDLAETTTDRERYFILGSYYARFLKDYGKAVEAYEVLVELYPDDYWGTNNLVSAYYNAGQAQKTLPYRERSARLRPNDWAAQVATARAIVLVNGDLARARPFVQRAQTLTTSETDRRYSAEQTAWFRLWPAIEYWSRGEVEKALVEVARLEKSLDARSGREQEAFAFAVSGFYWTLGKRKAALAMSQRFGNFKWLATDAYVLGDFSLARKLHRDLPDPGPVSVLRMARLGLVREAERALPSISNNPAWTEGAVRIVRGEIALARGRTGEAIALLEAGVQAAWSNALTAFSGWESLATAWERQGDLKKAARALEKATALKFALMPVYSARWSEVRLRQAHVYRKLGRLAEAQEIEAELRKLLAVADEDYPILIQLKQIQERDRPTASPQQRRAR